MNALELVQHSLDQAAEPDRIDVLQRFFKTGVGEYAEGDRFRGVRVPNVRIIAKEHRHLVIPDVVDLLHSVWHEDRLCALLILVDRYRRSDHSRRSEIAALYLRHRASVNHWDLVDASAMHLLGAHVFENDEPAILFELASSESLWDRRIAVISTFAHIRKKEFDVTLRLCENLLTDRHDLIHKACGWMLREIGNRDPHALRGFLSSYSEQMPRTMLRYAIEKLDADERHHWMNRTS